MTLRDAQQIAHGLIQGYIGPDHKVMDMRAFFGALVQALEAAHQQGRRDGPEGEKSPSITDRDAVRRREQSR
jgi:hypothetical protein